MPPFDTKKVYAEQVQGAMPGYNGSSLLYLGVLLRIRLVMEKCREHQSKR